MGLFFSNQHTKIMLNFSIASAPRDLTVRMGASNYELRYEVNNAPSQTFQLEHAPHLIDELELRILSSWFHPDGIACLYKIQLY